MDRDELELLDGSMHATLKDTVSNTISITSSTMSTLSSLVPSSPSITMGSNLHKVDSFVSVQDEEEEDGEEEVDHVKEIGNIAEREISLNQFIKDLRIKRSVIGCCYFILFVVEVIYFDYFQYWFICPLLLCIIWSLLIIMNTNLYQYLYKQTLMRFILMVLISVFNIMSVMSLIIIYAMNFALMYHFDHAQDYCLKLVIIFNILFLFCSFCIDIDIINYSEYTVIPFKIIFLGIMHHEQYTIADMNGKWMTKQYKFQHPIHLQSPSEKVSSPEISNHCPRIYRNVQPIGIWQRLIILLFSISLLGSVIFAIHGIQEMQPYISD